MAKTRILITGISGYVGSNAAEYFAKAGYDVHGISLGGTAGKIRKTDITDATSVRSAIRSIKPDIIFHAAAVSSLRKCEENQKECHAVNAIGTKNLVDALLAIKPEAAFIFISSDYVFEGKRDNYAEKDAPQPRTAYGKSKLLAEHEAASMKNHMIVRTSSIFGRGGNFFTYLLESFKAGREVEAYTDAFYTPTYIDFLLDSISNLLARKFIGAIHVAGKERISRHQFALKLVRAMGRNAGLAKEARLPSGELIAHDSSLDCSMLHRTIGTGGPSVPKAIDYALGNLIYPYFNYTDARGSITGITQGREWKEINFITSKKGTSRGGHYHRETKEGIFVVQGRMRIKMLDMKGRKSWGFTAEQGDFFIILPHVSHTFEMLEDSSWANMLTKPMAGKQKDIWKA